MALHPCRECGKQVSTEAATCPQCGVPEPTRDYTPPPPPVAPAEEIRPAARPDRGAGEGSEKSGSGMGRLIPAGIVLAFVLFAVVMISAHLSERSAGTVFGAASMNTEERSRRFDSLRALEILAQPGAVPDSTVQELERIIHGRAMDIQHDSLHRRAVSMALDSASAALEEKDNGVGNYIRAERFLSTLYMVQPLTEQQVSRRDALRTAANAERDRGEKAQRQADSDRQIASIRDTSICKVSEARARAILDRIPGSAIEVQRAAACERVRIGMTPDEVRAAWGRPRDINRSTYSFGVHEQWVYGEWGSSYVYFENGVVTATQT